MEACHFTLCSWSPRPYNAQSAEGTEMRSHAPGRDLQYGIGQNNGVVQHNTWCGFLLNLYFIHVFFFFYRKVSSIKIHK